SSPRIATTHTHGTGCTLSAAIAARLALGDDVPTAVEKAKDYVWRALANAPRHIGRGRGPVAWRH
ncbi:MAG: hydroxymethylpyrimidine/phosphomethylpyrimidine kinase, partial [Bacteroidia bacterium]|nr:hydroxymethylpyrimidine/phosphomethylpyrimidine kinase [Bacteroidia bacterium]